MAAYTLRTFEDTDPDWLRAWYRTDKVGMESFFGIPLEEEATYLGAFNTVLQGVRAGRAEFWMLDCDTEPMGFFLMTDFTPDGRAARIHIYIDVDQRRHSFRAAKVIESTLTRRMQERGLTHVVASQPRTHRGAHALAKRLGFHEMPQMWLTKELSNG